MPQYAPAGHDSQIGSPVVELLVKYEPGGQAKHEEKFIDPQTAVMYPSEHGVGVTVPSLGQ